MKSFVFWLTTAVALGAVLAMILRPGVQEILIVWAVANGLYYGARNVRKKAASPVT